VKIITINEIIASITENVLAFFFTLIIAHNPFSESKSMHLLLQ